LEWKRGKIQGRNVHEASDTLFQQHHSRGEEMGKQISFPAKMQSYGQILFVRILLHPKIFLQEKLLLS